MFADTSREIGSIKDRRMQLLATLWGQCLSDNEVEE
jgi:hypothetical protein